MLAFAALWDDFFHPAELDVNIFESQRRLRAFFMGPQLGELISRHVLEGTEEIGERCRKTQWGMQGSQQQDSCQGVKNMGSWMQARKGSQEGLGRQTVLSSM